MLVSGVGHKDMRVEVVNGAQAALDRLNSHAPAIEKWGQSDELAELPYLISVPVLPRRKPLLVLLHSGTESSASLIGAVLVFAYATQIAGLRLLAHPDRTGRRCVFGPAHERTAITAAAARAMLQRGAKLISLPYRIDQPGIPSDDETLSAKRKQNALAALGMMGLPANIGWTLRSAKRRLELPLEPTLDATLELVGKRTRRNLRAATRLCLRETGAELVWNPEVSYRDLSSVNATATHRVRSAVLDWRYEVWKTQAGAFVAGLRGADGNWLALAGGRCNGDAVTLDWQMNGRHYARYSVSLVMRGLLIARFGAERFTRMRFEGGTAHTLNSGFRTGTVYTLRAGQNAVWLRALEYILTRWLSNRAITRSLFGKRQEAGSRKQEAANR